MAISYTGGRNAELEAERNKKKASLGGPVGIYSPSSGTPAPPAPPGASGGFTMSSSGSGSASGASGGTAGGAGTSVTTQMSPTLTGYQQQTQEQINKMKAAAPDPNLQKQVERLDERLSTDTTQRAIDRATSSIADAAAARKSGRATELARRGVLGGGVGDQEMGKISSAADRAKAGAAADITLQREKDLDALVIGGQGIMSAPGQFGMAQQGQLLGAIGQGAGLGVETEQLAQGYGAQALTQQQIDQQAQEQAFAQWLATMNLSRGSDYAPGGYAG